MESTVTVTVSLLSSSPVDPATLAAVKRLISDQLNHSSDMALDDFYAPGHSVASVNVGFPVVA